MSLVLKRKFQVPQFKDSGEHTIKGRVSKYERRGELIEKDTLLISHQYFLFTHFFVS